MLTPEGARHTTRDARFSCRLTLTAILLALTPRAAAADALEAADGEVELSTYLAMGRGLWIFASAGAAMWFVEHLSVGAYFDAALVGEPFGADCSNAFCAQREYKVGSRARWHLFPTTIADPWVGAGIGGRFDVGGQGTISGLDASVSVGADVRLGSVGFGPFGFVELPLVNNADRFNNADLYSKPGQAGLGIRGALAF